MQTPSRTAPDSGSDDRAARALVRQLMRRVGSGPLASLAPGRSRIEIVLDGAPRDVRRCWYAAAGLRRPQDLVNHDRRELRDPRSERGVLLVARDERGAVLGTLQTTPIGPRSAGRGDAACGRRSTTSSKLWVRRSARGSRALMDLAILAYDSGLAADVRHDHASCPVELVPLLRRFGYRDAPAARLESGPLDRLHERRVALRLDLHALAHLEACGSPFGRACRAHFEGLDVRQASTVG